MTRLTILVAGLVFLSPASARADVFDRYTNPILAKATEADGVKEIAKLTPDLIDKHSKLVPNLPAALVVVRTQTGMNGKLLVQVARQRTSDGSVPMMLVNRYVSYKPSEERALQASGQNVHLYQGFLLNLEIGQVAPSEVGGDVRFVADKDHGYLEPVGKAKMYLVTKPIPGTEPKKTDKPIVGDTFEARYFNGTYRLQDDGRRSAKITLKVDDDGEVTGDYVSEQTGRKYEITGKVSATPKHHLQFTVKFPQAQQSFQGWMFTKDGRAICGTTKLQEHEFGFFALRLDEE